MTTTQTVYIDTAEVAKMIRRDLKALFPGTKFSVRIDRYAGGSSIRVNYTDGPAVIEVERKVTNHYVGSSFDGMIDLKSSVYREVDGQRVRYGSDHVFVNRQVTEPFLRAVAETFCQKHGVAVPTIDVSEWAGARCLWSENPEYIGRYTVAEQVNGYAQNVNADTMEYHDRWS